MKAHFLEARRVYQEGGNVSIALRDTIDEQAYSEVIQYAYDLQAGTYTNALDDPATRGLKERAGTRLAKLIRELGVTSFCDAGTGEATTLKYVLDHLDPALPVSAFDISLSRLFFAQEMLGQDRVALFCGDLMSIPLVDSAVDAVTTFHALEPNGGREKQLVHELLRVASRYLVLVEPDFEKGTPTQRARMERLNYIRGLREVLGTFPGSIVVDERWDDDSNPDNAASLIVFEKAQSAAPTFGFRSPISGQPLDILEDGFLGSPADGFLYPLIRGVPSLLESTAVLASHYWSFAGDTAKGSAR